MSLINEALRRAAQKQTPVSSAAETQAGLEVVNHSRRTGSWAFRVGGVALIFFLLLISVWLIVRATNSPKPIAVADPIQIQVVGPASAFVKPDRVNPTVAEPASTVATRTPEPVKEPVTSDKATQISEPTHPVASAPAAMVTNLTVAARQEPNVATDAPSPVTVSVPEAPAATPVVKPAFPALTVQGIYFRKVNPSALINGRTIFVGETIHNARVVAIRKESVVVVFKGQTNVLYLP
jgi:hypothetical protein